MALFSTIVPAAIVPSAGVLVLTSRLPSSSPFTVRSSYHAATRSSLTSTHRFEPNQRYCCLPCAHIVRCYQGHPYATRGTYSMETPTDHPYPCQSPASSASGSARLTSAPEPHRRSENDQSQGGRHHRIMNQLSQLPGPTLKKSQKPSALATEKTSLGPNLPRSVGRL